MNLETFISATITQIARGIEKAADNLTDSTALVSPRNVRPIGNKEFKGYGYLEDNPTPSYMRVVEEIEFDIAVTAMEGTGTRGGIGIMVGTIGLGSQGRSDKESDEHEFEPHVM